LDIKQEIEAKVLEAQRQLHEAVAALQAGGVILHATEGVWGFACDPFDANAVQMILDLKGREANKGFIVIAAAARYFHNQLETLSEDQRQTVEATWPGPHTWILPDDFYPQIIRGGRNTLACRVPGHDQARRLCELLDKPVISTSANLSGQPGIVTQQQAQALFGERVAYLLPGAVLVPGKASTIHTLDGAILR
jgi:L-threonylcarbamoyladenylate synthase